MADFEIPGLLGPIVDFANSQSFGGWINIGIDILVSTIVGGIVLLIVAEIVSKAGGEQIKAANAFPVVLLIKMINTFVIFMLLSYLSFIPYSFIIVPLLIWIGLVKAFFSGLSALHAVAVGAVGFAVSIILVPSLVGMVISAGIIPNF